MSITKLEDKFKMEWPKITLFGDSITRRSNDPDNGCWGGLIDYKVGAYFDVDVRGFEGYNTKWALEIAPQLFPKSYLDKVEVFVLFFGHNDSWSPGVPMHVPVAEFEANTRNIIKYLGDNGLDKSKIILITPTWYHHESFKKWLESAGMPPVGKELEAAKKYSEVVLNIAKSESIDVIDFFGVSLKYEQLETMFCDGVHFSQHGAKMLFEQVMPVIEKKIVTKYKKPLVDLWHIIPFDQRPEVKAVMGAYMQSKKDGN